MSDGKAHIRDVMSISMEDFKEGRIPTKTICDLNDPDHNKLEFADPAVVVNRSLPNYCPKCRTGFIQETEGTTQKNALKKFRKMIHDIMNGSKARSIKR